MSNSDRKRIVIVGATSTIARHCARLWLAEYKCVDLTLVGRDLARIERVASDLRVRSPKSSIEVLTVDFLCPDAIKRLAQDLTDPSPVDIVLIAHGSLPDQNLCQEDLSVCAKAISINAISPALFAEAFAGAMENAHKGTLGIIGSVAGDRGRKSNYVYGSAKGFLERYAEGLQHRLARKAVRIVLVKPGPTETPMTSNMPQPSLKLASPEVVARHIVDGMKKGSPTLYTPRKWFLIMAVLKYLPRFIFNRINI